MLRAKPDHTARTLLALLVGVLVAASPQAVPADSDAQEQCQVGNPDDPIGEPLPDQVFGQEDWAYLIYPPDQCDFEDDGFRLERVNVLFFFDAEQVPTTFVATAFLREAVIERDRPCYVPGPLLYESPPVTVVIEEPGFQLLTVPTPDCPCEEFDARYFIGVSILEPLQAGLPIDDEGSRCTTYIDRGNGWMDFYDLKFSSDGSPIIWGDIISCELGVATENDTWSNIKGLYR